MLRRWNQVLRDIQWKQKKKLFAIVLAVILAVVGTSVLSMGVLCAPSVAN